MEFVGVDVKPVVVAVRQDRRQRIDRCPSADRFSYSRGSSWRGIDKEAFQPLGWPYLPGVKKGELSARLKPASQSMMRRDGAVPNT